MKQYITYLIGIVTLLFSACQDEKLEISADEAETPETVSLSFSFENSYQTGTDYEPMTKADDQSRIVISNGYYYLVTKSYALNLYEVVEYGTACLDQDKGPEEYINITPNTTFDLNIPLPPGHYRIDIFTGAQACQWNDEIQKGVSISRGWSKQNMPVITYKDGQTLSEEIFHGGGSVTVTKTTDLPTVNHNNFELWLGRAVGKLRVVLKDNRTEGGLSISDLIEGEDLFIHMLVKGSTNSYGYIPMGLTIGGEAWYSENYQWDTVDYISSVRKTYQATDGTEEWYYIANKIESEDLLYAPYLITDQYVNAISLENIYCESKTNSGTVSFVYKGKMGYFIYPNQIIELAFELTDERDEEGNYILKPFKKKQSQNRIAETIFSSDFEYSTP